MLASSQDIFSSRSSLFDGPPSARSALDRLTTELLSRRGRGSVWRVSAASGLDTRQILEQLQSLDGDDLALTFEPAIFEQVDDPAALITFIAAHARDVVLAFEPSRAAAHPLTREDFERRLLLQGASFRELIALDRDGRAYALRFQGHQR